MPADRLPIVSFNEIRYSETRASRTLEARFTDTAVDSLAAPLGLFFGTRVVDRSTAIPRMASVDDADIVPAQLSLPETSVPYRIIDDATELPAPLSISTAPEASDNPIWNVFRPDGERLRLDDSRLKAQNQKDAVQRLAYLQLAAGAAMGKEAVPRSELLDMAKDLGLYDGNWSRVLKNATDLELDGDLVSLRRPGRLMVEQYLKEITDDSVADQWPISNAGRGRPSRVMSTPEEIDVTVDSPSRRKSQSKATKAELYLRAWRELQMPVDGHEVIRDRGAAEQALFGLWAIRSAMGEAGKEVSKRPLSQFLWLAFEVKRSDSALESALRDSPVAKGKVENVRGSTFQINPTGIRFVDAMPGMPSTVAASGNGSTIHRR